MTLFGPIAILIIAALGIYISACTLLNGRPIGIAVLLEEIVIPFAEAQTLDIYGQLKAGSRHFDLRPFEANQDDEDQCSEGLCAPLLRTSFTFTILLRVEPIVKKSLDILGVGPRGNVGGIKPQHLYDASQQVFVMCMQHVTMLQLTTQIFYGIFLGTGKECIPTETILILRKLKMMR